MGRKHVGQTSGKASSEKQARDARLKAALKANMQRRKAQARARSEPGADDLDNDTSPKGGQEQA